MPAPARTSTPSARVATPAPPVAARVAAPARSPSSTSAVPAIQSQPPAIRLGADAARLIASNPGEPLPPPIRTALEQSYQVDLQAVRVHANAPAQQTTRAMAARAFTYGPHIFLGPGEQATDVTLMAHEVAHVVQQQAAPAVQRWAIAGSADHFEREADHAAASAQAGQHATIASRTGGQRPQFSVGSWVSGVAGSVVSGVRAAASAVAETVGDIAGAALGFIKDHANAIPGFRMFTIVLGVNPIDMSTTDRSAANILRAVVEFIPGGTQITQALDNHGVFDKVGRWVEQQIKSLGLVGSAIKAAITQFIGTLSAGDILQLGDVWERAKRIFTEPIDRIMAFAKGLIDGILQIIKDAILRPLAKLAEGTEGYNLLKAVMGKDPITGDQVPRTAENLIGPFMKLIGQEEVWENMKKANAIPRAWAWFQSALNGLLGFVQEIPSLFIAALKSLTIADIILVPLAFAKLVKVFGGFVVRFVTWAGNAVWNLLEIIFDVVSPGAFDYIKRTGAALKSILKNPLPFVGNLVKAAKLGFQNFADNIGTHLKAGLIDWLTGSLSGVYIPKALSLAELGKFALSVLGISWAQIRAKIVKVLGPNGETIMQGLEVAFDVVKTLVTGGPAAAWEMIKEKLTNLKDMAIDAIKGFVVDTIVKKAVPKLIAMFIPGAGFISAIVSIYDTVMVFVQKISKIIQVVKGFIDSIVAIAGGVINAATKRVESTLAGLLSLAISFLAGFLGLGKITDKIKEVIEKVRAIVDKAIDTAIAWIVNKAKTLFAKLFGKKDKKDDRTDAQKQADLDRAVNAAQALQDDPKISDEKLRSRLVSIKKQFALTKLELVVDSDQEESEKIHIEAEINPKKPTKQSGKSKGILFVSASGSKPPGRSSVGALPITPTASSGVFEQRAGQSLEAATGQTAQSGVPLPAKLGAPILLTQTRVGTDPGLSQIPDYLRLSKKKIEVFEITLDANFEIGRPSTGSSVSHKRVQLAGAIHQLATQYPGVTIVYNIRSTKDAPEKVRNELEIELRSLRRHLATQGLSNEVQIIWRYG